MILISAIGLESNMKNIPKQFWIQIGYNQNNKSEKVMTSIKSLLNNREEDIRWKQNLVKLFEDNRFKTNTTVRKIRTVRTIQKIEANRNIMS